MVQCGKCGLDGHVARDCQYSADIEGRPPWCGECDPVTRLIDHGSYMQRCYRCWAWPAKGTRHHQPLPQHRHCGGCRELVYAWDSARCGSHEPLSLTAHGWTRPPEPAAGVARIAAQAREKLADQAGNAPEVEPLTPPKESP